MRRLAKRLVGLVIILSSMNHANAADLQILTDTSWRAIGPLGNQAGIPINDVGSSWEIPYSGWNSDLNFDDSDNAGWRNAIPYPYSPCVPPANAIWVDGTNGTDGSTPAYFRKKFFLDGIASSATLNLWVDDDAQAYINGTLVIDDHDNTAYDSYQIDVTSRLVAGENLIAIKAQDSFGIYEGLCVDLQVDSVPEPSTVTMLVIGVFGLLAYAWRRQKWQA